MHSEADIGEAEVAEVSQALVLLLACFTRGQAANLTEMDEQAQREDSRPPTGETGDTADTSAASAEAPHLHERPMVRGSCPELQVFT